MKASVILIVILIVLLLIFASILSYTSHTGPLAYYTPFTDTIHMNHSRIEKDVECDLCYFRKPTTPTGKQKREVFNRMDPDGRDLRAWMDKQPDRVQAYKDFIMAHEKAHRKLHRYSPHYSLMDERTIKQEVEANLDAYAQLGVRL